MKRVITPLRVGVLVIASGIFLFVFLSFSKKGGLSGRDALSVYALFRDASGLGRKSRVQIAGLPVGEIDEITLTRVKTKVRDPNTGEEHEESVSKARVHLKIRRSVGLKEDAAITKRSESVLGDYMLDLYPGSDASPPMPDGGEIKKVNDAVGIEALFESLSRITNNVQDVTGALRRVLGGEPGATSLERIVDSMVKMSDTVDTSVRQSAVKLDTILANFQVFSADIRSLTAGQQESIHNIINNTESVTRDMKEVVATVKKIIGPETGEEGLQESVASLKQVLNRLDTSLQNIEQVTNKVKGGQSVAGVLLSDERLGQKVSETVEDVSDFASRLTRLQAEVSIKSDYMVSERASKVTFGFRLIPKPDKYYLLELIDDPRGKVETQTVQFNPPQTGQPTTQIQRITKQSLKFSAQFAKRFYFATLRLGIIESSGGIGGDIHFLGDALSVKLDAFDFTAERLWYPRLRASVRAQFFQHLFINVGVDDILNRQLRDATSNQLIAGRELFFGGGVFFTDDDLKSILTVSPVRP